MKGGKRKRGKSNNESVSKKIKVAFDNLLNTVNERAENVDILRHDNNDRERGSEKIKNIFETWVESVKNQNDEQQQQQQQQGPRGEERQSLSQLKNRDDYLRIGNSSRGIDFLIRRSSVVDANNLYMREASYEVEVRTSPELENVTLAGFIYSLWDIFDRLFSDCLSQKDYEEICFHVTHRDLEGSLSSSIYELREENRDRIIYEIMNRLTGWNQSSNPSAAVKHLGIAVTLLRRSLTSYRRR
jgi:uncharacterized protein YciU (UPF0263 family)